MIFEILDSRLMPLPCQPAREMSIELLAQSPFSLAVNMLKESTLKHFSEPIADNQRGAYLPQQWQAK